MDAGTLTDPNFWILTRRCPFQKPPLTGGRSHISELDQLTYERNCLNIVGAYEDCTRTLPNPTTCDNLFRTSSKHLMPVKRASDGLQEGQTSEHETRGCKLVISLPVLEESSVWPLLRSMASCFGDLMALPASISANRLPVV